MFRRAKEKLDKKFGLKLEDLPNLECNKISSSNKRSEVEFPEQKLQPKDDPKVTELADLIRRVRIEHPDKFVQKPKLNRSKTQIIFTSKEYRDTKGVLNEYVRRLPCIREETPLKKYLPKI